jgi:hypothetical protein
MNEKWTEIEKEFWKFVPTRDDFSEQIVYLDERHHR